MVEFSHPRLLEGCLWKARVVCQRRQRGGVCEHWVGSGSAFQSMALFTLGTGVGGGIIIGELSIDVKIVPAASSGIQ